MKSSVIRNNSCSFEIRQIKQPLLLFLILFSPLLLPPSSPPLPLLFLSFFSSFFLQNSWGPAWGTDNGYVLIQRGASIKEGECGVLKDAVFPVLKK